MKKANHIQTWCERIIAGPGGLQAFERLELAIPTVPRDVAIACWVIRCLGNNQMADTQAVVDAILEQRKKRATVAGAAGESPTGNEPGEWR